MVEIIKNEINGCISRMPEHQLIHVLHYIRFMLSDQSHKPDDITAGKEKTFIREYIGGVSHGSLAADIDEELYG